MTFVEKYHIADNWHDKVLIMSLFHTVMSSSDDSWTLSKTAKEFEVSIGLVSENLKLALAIDKNPKLLKIETRQDALKKLK